MLIKSLFKASSTVLACLVFAGCSNQPSLTPLSHDAQYGKSRDVEHFDDYVDFLKGKAKGAGVSDAVLSEQKQIQYIQKAVDLDRQQAGKVRPKDPNQPIRLNPNGTTNYLNRVLTQRKVDVAEKRYWEQQTALEKASQRFGVPKEYLLALWGMESSFGYYQGSYDVLSVLATLAFEGRRETLFSQEFVSAMKMLDRKDISRQRMLGSWAGAMGQTQFMPSSYLRYATDGNQDGEKDIWKNHDDVFASIARYLSSVGWNKDLPWGVEVMLTQPLDLALAGIEKEKQRSLSDWQKMGIMLKFPSTENQQKWTALSATGLWLVRPDREVGRAFLVSNNYRTLLDWNRSHYFAISIGMFADRIKQQVGL
ncbi:lytic murein transglycosylase [Pasteurella sp. PK-2025]|uniref:lytic murein transglycosylase n=1 Tax=unclassified Pasteurella TaxID=2621516 RepID=UPI003C70629B